MKYVLPKLPGSRFPASKQTPSFEVIWLKQTSKSYLPRDALKTDLTTYRGMKPKLRAYVFQIILTSLTTRSEYSRKITKDELVARICIADFFRWDWGWLELTGTSERSENHPRPRFRQGTWLTQALTFNTAGWATVLVAVSKGASPSSSLWTR